MITALVLVLAMLALIGVAIGSLWSFIDGFTPAPMPPDFGADPDDTRWNDEAVELGHGALTKVQDTAKKWGETIAGLLGIFGVVAFVKGPEAFADIPGRTAWVVVAVVALAALAAAAAVYTGALAAQGSPARLDPLNGWTLKQLTQARTATATTLLRVSRAFALAAAVLLLAAMAVSWTATLDARGEKAETFAVVVWDDGSATCGKLDSDAAGISIETDAETRPLRAVRQVVRVASCPAD